MDCAEASDRCCTIVARDKYSAAMSRRAWKSRGSLDVNLGEAASGADLGGSSNYSNGNFEDRSGEGFHVKSILTWVRRS